MVFAQGFARSEPVLAWRPGFFAIVGIILGIVLVIYAVYYLVFRMGK